MKFLHLCMYDPVLQVLYSTCSTQWNLYFAAVVLRGCWLDGATKCLRNSHAEVFYLVFIFYFVHYSYKVRHENSKARHDNYLPRHDNFLAIYVNSLARHVNSLARHVNSLAICT